MFKKLIAGVASVTLALGMVALTGGPASATQGPSHDVTANCQTVSVDLKGYDDDETNHVTVYLDGSVVADANFSKNFKESYNFATIAASHTYRVIVTAVPSGEGNYDTGVVTLNACLVDDDKETKKQVICHWQPAQGGKYTRNDVSLNSIINNPNGHFYDPNDIIPPFDYVEGGVVVHFGGLNWGELGQYIFNNPDGNKAGCGDIVPVTPDKFGSQCADGQASAPTFTVAGTPFVQYQVNINGGGWSDIAAGPHNATAGSTYEFRAYVSVIGGSPELVVLGSLVFGAALDCTQYSGVTGDPLWHDAFCQRDGNTPVAGSFEVVAVAHVNYTVSINGALPAVAIAAGTYPANPGDHVEIWAHADPGWTLQVDAESYWEHTFGAAVACELAPPVLSCLLADIEDDITFITLPAIAHLKWIVNGAPAAAGPIDVPLSVLETEIQAVADAGYDFTAGTTFWVFILDEEGECGFPTLPDWEVNATKTDQTCSAGGTVSGTIIVGAGVLGGPFLDEVNYFINGNLVTSATTAVAPGTYTVTAEPIHLGDGLDGYPEGGWELTVLAAPASCDLTTLALTGAGGNPTGWAGLGYYLLVAGLALIAVRTVHRRNEVKQ
jgi:hypothetical protein